MDYVKAFLIGGLICVIGQLLIDYTKLTPARILVAFVTLGVVLTAVGVYEPLVEFAGAGATVPLSGFGYSLAKGVEEAVQKDGFLGILPAGSPLVRRGLAPRFSWRFSPPWYRNPGTNPNRLGSPLSSATKSAHKPKTGTGVFFLGAENLGMVLCPASGKSLYSIFPGFGFFIPSVRLSGPLLPILEKTDKIKGGETFTACFSLTNCVFIIGSNNPNNVLALLHPFCVSQKSAVSLRLPQAESPPPQEWRKTSPIYFSFSKQTPP